MVVLRDRMVLPRKSDSNEEVVLDEESVVRRERMVFREDVEVPLRV